MAGQSPVRTPTKRQQGDDGKDLIKGSPVWIRVKKEEWCSGVLQSKHRDRCCIRLDLSNPSSTARGQDCEVPWNLSAHALPLNSVLRKPPSLNMHHAHRPLASLEVLQGDH